ncbi:DUF4244 domain-containing protein [Candidatus Frankia alpina]|uniref:DUF4244 domain-containing protein n=1 Tax=Candidatus Frankia alpina TaxID=2699483 RepID=A0A4S5EEF4_9ACTN|nr:DUF4244 domain-containing protein [Candidatus Frankia alpina]THJ70132.1 DUF4244 domain-containing protein [Candidatus Frankia alpina]
MFPSRMFPSSSRLSRSPFIWAVFRRALAGCRGTGSRDLGMSTAEYAVGTLAAVAFAGVLYAVVSSSTTRSLVSSVVQRALTASF